MFLRYLIIVFAISESVKNCSEMINVIFTKLRVFNNDSLLTDSVLDLLNKSIPIYTQIIQSNVHTAIKHIKTIDNFLLLPFSKFLSHGRIIRQPIDIKAIVDVMPNINEVIGIILNKPNTNNAMAMNEPKMAMLFAI